MRIAWPTHTWFTGTSDLERGWQEQVMQEVKLGSLSGLSRQEIVRRVAQKMYRQDARDLGPLVDLGLFTWEIYLRDAELAVDWLLQQRCSSETPAKRNQGVEG